MKPIKFVFKFVLWIVGIVLALVMTLPLWVGPVVKTAANLIVPKKTGTPFNLGAFQLNPYVGRLHVGDVNLANPQGFDPSMALTLGKLSVEVDPLSLAGDLIIVKDITLTDLFVSYVANRNNESNLGVIVRNATGENPDGEKIAEYVEEPKAKRTAMDGKTGGRKSEKKAERKVIIDHLLVANVVVRFGPMEAPMPDIELLDIGRKSNGVTIEEAWQQVYAQVSANFGAMGVNLNGLIEHFSIGTDSLNEALKTIDASKIMKSEHIQGVLNTTGQTLGATGKTTGQALNTATETTSKAADAVNQGVDKANKAIDAIKGLF